MLLCWVFATETSQVRTSVHGSHWNGLCRVCACGFFFLVSVVSPGGAIYCFASQTRKGKHDSLQGRKEQCRQPSLPFSCKKEKNKLSFPLTQWSLLPVWERKKGELFSAGRALIFFPECDSWACTTLGCMIEGASKPTVWQKSPVTGHAPPLDVTSFKTFNNLSSQPYMTSTTGQQKKHLSGSST